LLFESEFLRPRRAFTRQGFDRGNKATLRLRSATAPSQSRLCLRGARIDIKVFELTKLSLRRQMY
jgi:hypothetical protein